MLSFVAPISPLLATTSPVPLVLFYSVAIMTVGGALSVALSRNIVRAAVGLLFALAGTAGLYMLLSAEFIAAVQLVVYVGGTLILIVFGVMLTSKSPSLRWEPKHWEVVWALVVAGLVATPLVVLMSTAPFPLAREGMLPVGQAAEAAKYPIFELGQALLDPAVFLVPFELVSVLLLAVMIGAAYLAKGRIKKIEEAQRH